MTQRPETVPETAGDVLDVVVRALADEVGIAPERVEPDQPLRAVPEIESIHVLRAVTAIEESCAVIIPDDFLFESSTVRELADAVSRLRDGR